MEGAHYKAYHVNIREFLPRGKMLVWAFSEFLPLSMFGALVCVFLLRITHGQTDPLQEFNILESYKTANQHRCQRLCWYRTSCLSVTFYNKNDNPGGRGDNCVLHVNGVSGQALKDGWVEIAASANGMPADHGCISRQCSSSQMCMPAKSSSVCADMSTVCRSLQLQGQYRHYEHYDLKSYDFHRLLNTTGLDICKSTCDSTPQCLAIVRSSQTTHCYFKFVSVRDEPSAMIYNIELDTYVKLCV